MLRRVQQIAFGLICSTLTVFQARADVIAYDNTSNVSAAVDFNGTTNVGGNDIASMNVDDIHVVASYGGAKVTQLSFVAFNPFSVSVLARASVYFWLADGSNGGPGTFLESLFLPVTGIAPGRSLLTSAVSGLVVPANGTFWAGIAYDDANGTTGATAAQIGGLGGFLGGPNTVGYSDPSQVYFIRSTSPFDVNNPAVNRFTYDPGVALNYGWQFRVSAVPEPCSITLLGLGLAGAIRLRRRGVVSRVKSEPPR